MLEPFKSKPAYCKKNFAMLLVRNRFEDCHMPQLIALLPLKDLMILKRIHYLLNSERPLYKRDADSRLAQGRHSRCSHLLNFRYIHLFQTSAVDIW